MKSAFLILLTAAALSSRLQSFATPCPRTAEPRMRTADERRFRRRTSRAAAAASRCRRSRPSERRLMQQLVVYFEYDEADILPEFNALLQAHGQFLAHNPNTQLRLEGHADERGSREYNIGLGERRAQAVRRVLMLQGAAGTQLTTVSYGEERPAQTGSDDEAWRLNRRVELVYR